MGMKVENELVKIEEAASGKIHLEFKDKDSGGFNILTFEELGALAKAVQKLRPWPWPCSPDACGDAWTGGWNAALNEAASKWLPNSGIHQMIMTLRREPTTGVVSAIGALQDHELDALISWHRDEQYRCSKVEDYVSAGDHKRRREELEKMKGDGK